jgi:hypothetical protein
LWTNTGGINCDNYVFRSHSLIYKSKESKPEPGQPIDGPVYAVESGLHSTRAADDVVHHMVVVK